jgi:hypothetical protein
MSLTETQNRTTENGGIFSLRSTLRLIPATPYFPVKFGCAGFGIHELDRLRGLTLRRSSDENDRTEKTRSQSPGYVRNYAAEEMGRTALFEKVLMGVLAVGGVISIWAGTVGMNDLLSRWSGFVDLVGSVLR